LEWLDRSFYEEWEKDSSPPFVDDRTFHSYVDSLDDIRNGLIANLNLGDFSMLENIIADIIKKNEIDDVDKQSTLYRKLCAEIHKAEIKLIPIQKRHMTCDFSYKNELPDVFPEIFPRISEGSPAIDEQESETLQRVFEAFWKEKEPGWKDRTVTEYTTCRNHLLSFLGPDTQIHTVDYQKGRDYKNLLMETRNKKGKPLSKRRINMYLSFASQLFNYAERNHFIDRNPFKGLQISEKKTRVDELRDVFDTEDLKKVFCYSKEYLEDDHIQPHNFWVPILGLYTGCRLEELCQLYVSDLIEIDGTWCLNIVEDKPDKSVKTGEKRVVPLHPFIIEDLNFVGYVKSLSNQEGRVFPDLKRINNRYGHYFSRWFSQFKKKSGIVAPSGKKTFHSFRHTLINHLKQNDVPEHYIAEFVGHAVQSITMGRYGKKYKPDKLFENVVLKLDYGIDLSHLKNNRFVIKDSSAPEV
jgi:integrase